MKLKIQKNLNTLRWIVLTSVFLMLFVMPWVYLYQTYVAAHAYDRLHPTEKTVYNSVDYGVKLVTALRKPFVKEAKPDLDAFKGTTWSGKLMGYAITDPLAVASQVAASKSIYWPFALTALIPILLTVLLGRFFCGWICPATLLYELNDNLASWLRRRGLPVTKRKLDRRLKYAVLVVGLLMSVAYGATVFASIYPPLLMGREMSYVIAFGSFSVGMTFLLITLLFDMFVARRGFCRTLCPGGALYSLLGKFRLVRIQRDVKTCNDCAKCNAVCQFGLDPMRDGFGMECNNCSACIKVCPEDSLLFSLRTSDIAYQGPGHEGKLAHKMESEKKQNEASEIPA